MKPLRASMVEMVELEAMARRVVPPEKDVEEQSFERFFRDEYERLGRALFLITGQVAEADDLAQDAMLRVFERWDRVAATASPVGYLYRTALNLHRSRLRRASVRLRLQPRPTPEPDALGAAEDRDELARLLATLPAGQREALVLVEWLGMSTEDAGTVLGIEPVSVRVRVSRAKAVLRGPIDGEDES